MTNARSIRTLLVLLLLALGAVTALSFAGSASAATKCGEKVLADWYDNGRIDRLYPLNCYEEAIDAIPSDIGPYVDAEDVITRALQGALHGNVVSGGGCDPSADGSSNDCANLPAAGTAATARTATGRTAGRATERTAASRWRLTSTRPRRPRCRSRWSCSAACLCCSSRPARSDTSRVAGRLRTPTKAATPATRRSSAAPRHPLSGRLQCPGPWRQQIPCKLRINFPSGPLPTLPCPLA